MNWIERMRPGTAGLMIAGAFVTAGLAGPVGVAAQDADAPPTVSCRCVDRDGNEIENCTCFRRPELGAVTFAPSMMFERRSQIGVFINHDQESELDARGARLTDVDEDGPAWEAGLREGDVVTHVNGRSLLDPLEDDAMEDDLNADQSLAVQRFVRMVGRLEPGEPAEFSVLRDGASRVFEVVPERARGIVSVTSRGPGGVYSFGWGDGEGTLRLREGEMLEEMRALEERLRTEGERIRATEVPEGVRLRSRALTEEMRGRMRELRERDGEARVWTFGGDLEALREGDGRAFTFRTDPCMVVRGSGAGALAWVGGSGSCQDGVVLIDLNPGLGSYFGADSGALVTEVREGAALGLEPGDVIRSIDGRTVEDAADARRILRSYEMDDEIELRILREGREMELLGRRRAEG